MTPQPDVVTDLAAEGAELDRMVCDLDEGQWALATPAVGWTVAHQIAHLAATFRLAALAAAQPGQFRSFMAKLRGDFNANVSAALAEYLAEEPPTLLARWRAERAAAEKALAAVPPGDLVPWLVRPLPAPVLAAAGMTETFAHGQDIADTLGVRPARTDRLRHIAEFAVRVWDFGYLARGLTPPDTTFRFELVGPSGALWTFGPEDAPQRITGPALDLCLLATRRRHRADLQLHATGADAEHWLDIAQAYRGPAGPGRQPGQFARE